MAANNADAQASAPYQVGYGMSSNGPTTNLYTEIFRNNARDDRNSAAPVTAASSGPAPQGQPGVASNTAQRGQPSTTVAANTVPPGQPAAIVQQEPPPPSAPTAYGISSNGPTTDLYTEIFGPRTQN